LIFFSILSLPPLLLLLLLGTTTEYRQSRALQNDE